MNRRSFFKALGLGTAAVVLPKPKRKETYSSEELQALIDQLWRIHVENARRGLKTLYYEKRKRKALRQFLWDNEFYWLYGSKPYGVEINGIRTTQGIVNYIFYPELNRKKDNDRTDSRSNRP